MEWVISPSLKGFAFCCSQFQLIPYGLLEINSLSSSMFPGYTERTHNTYKLCMFGRLPEMDVFFMQSKEAILTENIKMNDCALFVWILELWPTKVEGDLFSGNYIKTIFSPK